jgi:crossover junction endonuclease MUS81
MASQYPNPLYVKWVEEWLEVEKQRNTRGVQTYKKALESLKKCPIRFNHPSETEQLQGIGPLISNKLTQKMKDYCEENGLPSPQKPRGKKRAIVTGDHDGDEDDAHSPPMKQRKAKPYVPKLRTGAYAIVLALATLHEDDHTGLSKDKIIDLAQEHCDASFTAASHANKFYTAWNSMNTLKNNELVYQKKKGGGAHTYCLTDEGWECARRMEKANPGQVLKDNFITRESPSPTKSKSDRDVQEVSGLLSESVADLIPNGSSDAIPHFQPIILQPGTFTVHLVLDNREVRAKKDRGYIQEELQKHGVRPLVRGLSLGDMMWIAKPDNDTLLPSHGENNEIVLDWIVERKRLDDLIGSIKEGRFAEQKFRLRKSGVKNVIYIIEEHNLDGEQIKYWAEAIESSITSTQVVDKYFVKKTQKIDDTISYLVCMTNMLKGIYEKQELHVIPSSVLTTRNYLPLLKSLRATEPATDYHITYSAFHSLASKSETLILRDVYLKMLMCTRGITGEKALEIQKRWKTPVDFIEAFEKCGDGEEGRKKKSGLVSNAMGNLVGRKKIAKTLSVKISDVWGSDCYAEETPT